MTYTPRIENMKRVAFDTISARHMARREADGTADELTDLPLTEEDVQAAADAIIRFEKRGVPVNARQAATRDRQVRVNVRRWWNAPELHSPYVDVVAVRQAMALNAAAIGSLSHSEVYAFQDAMAAMGPDRFFDRPLPLPIPTKDVRTRQGQVHHSPSHRYEQYLKLGKVTQAMLVRWMRNGQARARGAADASGVEVVAA